ncbi:Uncharacterised protein [Escherichia coli]|nr:Uncharacterised protein [Escherichia coli]
MRLHLRKRHHQLSLIRRWVNTQKATSATAFNNAVETKSAQAVEEQTKILQTNDNKIIDGLENVSDEVVKLRKSVSSGNKFGLSDLWRNRASRRNKINIGDQAGKNKRNKPKRKGRNLGKKALSVGEKAAAEALLLELVPELQRLLKQRLVKPKTSAPQATHLRVLLKKQKTQQRQLSQQVLLPKRPQLKQVKLLQRKKPNP